MYMTRRTLVCINTRKTSDDNMTVIILRKTALLTALLKCRSRLFLWGARTPPGSVSRKVGEGLGLYAPPSASPWGRLISVSRPSGSCCRVHANWRTDPGRAGGGDATPQVNPLPRGRIHPTVCQLPGFSTHKHIKSRNVLEKTEFSQREIFIW